MNWGALVELVWNDAGRIKMKEEADWITCQPLFSSMPDEKQNSEVKARFTWRQSKCGWCHYSIAIHIAQSTFTL